MKVRVTVLVQSTNFYIIKLCYLAEIHSCFSSIDWGETFLNWKGTHAILG